MLFSFDELIIYFDEREHYNGYNIVIKKTNQIRDQIRVNFLYLMLIKIIQLLIFKENTKICYEHFQSKSYKNIERLASI